MAENPRPRILLVDDDAGVVDALKRTLRNRFEVDSACDGKEAIRLVLSRGPFAVVMSDLRMPGMDGISLLYLIRQAAPDTVRILLTGHADVEAAICAINQGCVFRFLTKPCPPAALIRALNESIEKYLATAHQSEPPEPTAPVPA